MTLNSFYDSGIRNSRINRFINFASDFFINFVDEGWFLRNFMIMGSIQGQRKKDFFFSLYIICFCIWQDIVCRISCLFLHDYGRSCKLYFSSFWITTYLITICAEHPIFLVGCMQYLCPLALLWTSFTVYKKERLKFTSFHNYQFRKKYNCILAKYKRGNTGKLIFSVWYLNL